MMNDTLDFALSLSIAPAVIIGIVRFKRIDKSYYPFLYNIFASLLVEVLARIFMVNGLIKPLLLLINTYFFIDFFLFTLLFFNWKLFGNNRKVFYAIIAVAFVTWVFTVFLSKGIFQPNFYFPVLHSFTLVFFSVTAFNKLIVHERRNIFTNARFWICLGVIIFYTFFLLTNATRLSVFRFNTSIGFRRSLHDINVYFNFLVNLMYAIAVLWTPRKKNFTSLL